MKILMQCNEHGCDSSEIVDVKDRSLDKVFLLIMLWHCAKHRKVSEDGMDQEYFYGLI